jgi:hypothetical protein
MVSMPFHSTERQRQRRKQSQAESDTQRQKHRDAETETLINTRKCAQCQEPHDKHEAPRTCWSIGASLTGAAPLVVCEYPTPMGCSK